MANVVVVGAQWGDEGKGKIVDWLSEQADIVVRFQGGHNAGHTLVINGETYKLALLPSGVLRPSKLAVIGNGVVFDPQAFLDEVTKLKAQGVAVSPENLRVAENVTLILPLHRELDALRESSNAVTAIGTTRRGIGPAYEDKVGRRAIRLMDLADLDTLPHKIDRLLAHHNALRRGLNLEEVDGGGILKDLTAFAPKLLPYAETVWRLLDLKRREGKRILFEGAQGALLDVDHAMEVCTGYMLDGKEIDHLPAGEGAQARVVPIYETIEGWKEPTANARSWADLPAQAIKYVRRVEELVGCPIALLSTSPEREDTILVQNPFEA